MLPKMKNHTRKLSGCSCYPYACMAHYNRQKREQRIKFNAHKIILLSLFNSSVNNKNSEGNIPPSVMLARERADNKRLIGI